MQVQSLGGEDLQKEGRATHSSILVWRIPWTQEPAELWSIGSQSVRHDWSDLASTQKVEAVQHWSLPMSLRAVCCAVLSCFSHVWPFDTLWTVACQAPPSMEIFQARILERVTLPSSRGSSWPRDRTWVSCITGRLFTHWATWEALGLRRSESNQSKESNFLNLSLVFQRMNTHLAAHLPKDLNIF